MKQFGILMLAMGLAAGPATWAASGPGGGGHIHGIAPGGTNYTAPFWPWDRAAPVSLVNGIIESAAEYDTIAFTNGTYLLSTPIRVNRPLYLHGLAGPESVVLDGINLDGEPCVILEHFEAQLGSVTVQNGGGPRGGGIEAEEGSILHCIVRNNQGGLGGGVYLGPGSMIEASLVVSNMTTGDGGGICATSTLGRSLITKCTITDNQAGRGGGVFAKQALVRNCIVARNRAMGNGGGVFLDIMSPGEAQVDSSTIADNQANMNGGGTDGGGFYFNTIVMHNRALSGSASNCVPSSLLMMNYCCTAPFPIIANYCTDQDPHFTNPAQGDFTISSSTSPCHNTGTNQLWMLDSYDLLDRARILEGVVDMGAFEFSLVSQAVLGLMPTQMFITVSAPIPLMFQIWNAGGSLLQVNLTTDQPWLSVSTNYAECLDTTHKNIGLGINSAMLDPGMNTGRVFIVHTFEPTNIQTVAVYVDNPPPAVLDVAPMMLSTSVYYMQPLPTDYLTVSNAGPSDFTFTTTHDQPWISVSPANGALVPEQYEILNLDYDTSLLGPGGHTADVVIASAEATNSPQVVTVTVNVLPIPAQLEVSPTNIEKTIAYDEPAPSIDFMIGNSGMVPLTYSIMDMPSWITIQNVTGGLNGGGFTNITMNFIKATMSVGLNYGRLRIVADTTNSPQYIDVNATLEAPAPGLHVAPTFFAHTNVVGEFIPSDMLIVSNSGTTPIDFAVTNLPVWLNANPMGGTLNGERATLVSLLYDPGQLPAGTYDEFFEVKAPATTNGWVEVALHMDILPTPGHAVVWPDPLVAHTMAGQPFPQLLLNVSNAGMADLTFHLDLEYGTGPAGWFEILTNEAVVTEGGVDPRLVDFDWDLPPGTYDGLIHVESDGEGPINRRAPAAYTNVIPIQLIVDPAPALAVDPNYFYHSITLGGGVPEELMTVSNNGQSSLDFSVSNMPPWLTVTPDHGTLFDEQAWPLSLSYDTSQLPLGMNECILKVYAPQATNAPAEVRVQVEVFPTPGQAVVWPTSLMAHAMQGQPFPQLLLNVSNAGMADLTFHLDLDYGTGGPGWFDVDTNECIVSEGYVKPLDIYFDWNLSPGTYDGAIHVDSDSEPPPSRMAPAAFTNVIPIQLIVDPAPTMSVSPTNLAIPVTADTSGVLGRFVVENIGSGGFDFQVENDKPWLMVPTNSIHITTNVQVWVYYNAAGLAPNEYTTTLILTSTNALGAPQYVGVQMTVTNGAGSLACFIEPPEVQDLGRWNLIEATGWRTNGEVIADVVAGVHTVVFQNVTGWMPPPPHLVRIIDGDTSVITGRYARLWTLSVSSPYGAPQPPRGPSSIAQGTMVTASMNDSPYYTVSTQFVCRGAVVTGNDFQFMSATNLRLVLTNDAALAWQWQTNFFLQLGHTGNGGISGPSEPWRPAGELVALRANPGPGWYFIGWGGDTNGASASGNQINVPMDHARNIQAAFSEVNWGWLRIDFDPADVVSAADWLDPNGLSHTNAEVVVLPTGRVTVTFGAVPGWTRPPPHTLTIMPDSTTVAGARYLPGDMVLVPAGSFQKGVYGGTGGVWTSVAEFHLDKYEVTVAQFRRFCLATERTMPIQPWSGETLPVVNVTWAAAQAYADWAGKRLPTDTEWEYAARAGSVTFFPWGDTITASDANYGGYVGQTRPHGYYPTNAFGLLDMPGNVWEWCADRIMIGSNTYQNIRGGSFATDKLFLQCAVPSQAEAAAQHVDLGFRCAADLVPMVTEPVSAPWPEEFLRALFMLLLE